MQMEEGLQEVEEAVHVYHCGQRAASASVFMGLTHHEKRGGDRHSPPGVSGLTPFRIKPTEEKHFVR